MSLASFVQAGQADVGSDVYVFKLGCNSDGTALAAATSMHDLCVFDPSSLKVVRSLAGHTDAVEDLCFFHANPACLASCSHDGTTRVWDLRASDAESRAFNVSNREVYSCGVGRNDAALACASGEKVHLFDIAAGKRATVYKDCHTDTVNHVRFHPIDTTKLLTGAEDNLVSVLDTNEPSEDKALLAVIPNEECVRSFTLVGPSRDTLCCTSTTDDMRIWGLGPSDCGTRKAEFLGLRCHPLLQSFGGGDDGDGTGGYVVETFYDEQTAQVLLLAGAGSEGNLFLFRMSLAEALPAAGFSLPSTQPGDGAQVLSGHTGIVRSAVCIPGGALVSAGEDGRVCAWRPSDETTDGYSGSGAGTRLELEPSAYSVAQMQRSGDRSVRQCPY